ncbi:MULTISPECIES: hypothetical protein [Kitasatospora]
MRLPKILGHALVSTALASSGLMLASGTAHATFSQCVDIIIANGSYFDDAKFGCEAGARGDSVTCLTGFPHSIPPAVVTAACTAAAVRP